MRLSLPRFTIERLRTLVLVGGVVLVLAIGILLGLGQWKLRRLAKDIPKRLGVDIQSQGNDVYYSQSRKGKTLFKIHAARAVQMKAAGRTLLHDVHIDLYGEDGTRADTISGSEFEYDPGAGIAEAAGEVEITLMKPGVKPAIAQLAPGAKPAAPAVKQPMVGNIAIPDSEIHVKTSGLTFNQKSGVATTAQRVDFALQQGSGSSMGATFTSSKGLLVLDHDVNLHVERNSARSHTGPVNLHADHAEFDRTEEVCRMQQAHAVYSGGRVETADALIHFREDGSVIRMDGSGGVDLQTQTGSHVAAPRGTLDFDEENHPQHGVLEGGVKLNVNQPARQIQGSSPRALLSFNAQGVLRQAHLEQGVTFDTQQWTSAKGAPVRLHRSWKSQVADVAFVDAPRGQGVGRGDGEQTGNQPRVELRSIHGTGGVFITSDSNAPGSSPSKLSADTVFAELRPGGGLSTLSGNGHAMFEQRTAAGVHQTSSSDQLDVRFREDGTAATHGGGKSPSENAEIDSIVQTGHVVLVQEAPPARPGGGSKTTSGTVRATADRSDYDGASEMLHLTGLPGGGSPRVRDGALDLTATVIDFARGSGDAFAHGDVKASWASSVNAGTALPGATLLGGGTTSGGGGGPVHAVAAEAELHQGTQEVIFRAASGGALSGSSDALPRLWQGANSIIAPLITLNRLKQTLTAQASGPATPVRTVLVTTQSAKGLAGSRSTGKASAANGVAQGSGPSVIRLRSGDLHYSEGERLAVLRGGPVGSVTAETSGPNGATTVVSQEADVRLLPAGVHSAPKTTSSAGSSASPSGSGVDQLIARGHVSVDWPDRKGSGEKLVYLSEDGTFTLTGTGAAPPRITDQVRGSVTGSALIFHSRDDSVTVEGNGGKTVTETQSPK